VAVLGGGAAELAHGHQDDVLHAVPHVDAESRDGVRELTQHLLHLLILIAVMVPALDLGEGGFDSGLGLDELSELTQVCAEFAALFVARWRWIPRSDGRNASYDSAVHGDGNRASRHTRLRQSLDDFDRLERVFAGSAERSIVGGRVHGLENRRLVL